MYSKDEYCPLRFRINWVIMSCYMGPLFIINIENYRNVVDIEQYLPTTYTSEYVTGNFVIKIKPYFNV